jgi:hypothetical protein
MASLLNTSTLEILRSADETKLSAPWVVIAESDAEAWMAVPPQYRKLAGQAIEEMTAQEKAAVDAARVQAARDAVVAQFDRQEDISRAVALLLLDVSNRQAQRFNALLNAIDAATTLANLKSAVALIQDVPVATERQLIDALKARYGS